MTCETESRFNCILLNPFVFHFISRTPLYIPCTNQIQRLQLTFFFESSGLILVNRTNPSVSAKPYRSNRKLQALRRYRGYTLCITFLSTLLSLFYAKKNSFFLKPTSYNIFFKSKPIFQIPGILNIISSKSFGIH